MRLRLFFIYIFLCFSFLNLFSQVHTVSIIGMSFSPDTVVITLGDTIEFGPLGFHNAVEVDENTWVANTTYQIGDIVTYGGYTYVAKNNHSTTTTPNADTTNWSVLTTGFENRGAYSASTAYAPGDLVRYGGYTYECKLNSTGNAPTDSTYWDVLSKGFEWKGNWAAATIYQKGDCVTSNSNT